MLAAMKPPNEIVLEGNRMSKGEDTHITNQELITSHAEETKTEIPGLPSNSLRKLIEQIVEEQLQDEQHRKFYDSLKDIVS